MWTLIDWRAAQKRSIRTAFSGFASLRRVMSRAARALVAAALLLTGCAAGHRDQGSEAQRVGLTLFSGAARNQVQLSGATLSGRQFTLRALRHHVVVVNVWASWCGPCRAESPLLARMAGRLRPRGVAFVGIDERDDAATARRFATQAGALYPELFDPSGELLSHLPQLPQMGIPSTLIIDADGRAAARIIGAAHPASLSRAVAAAARDG
jgi:thiol-disulfide isomerase/thioredoxin